MPETQLEAPQPERVSIETKDFPAIYCNQASVSISFNDIRLFCSEAVPQTVEVAAGKPEMRARQAAFRPHVSLVFTPEFARNLINALNGAVEKYERVFGPLRPEPSQEHVLKALGSE